MNFSILDELPVKMHAATEDKDITMRQIHRTCGSTVGVNSDKIDHEAVKSG
jgi:non-homologous end joining protein Ku